MEWNRGGAEDRGEDDERVAPSVGGDERLGKRKAALMVFFIVFMNTVAGVRSVDRARQFDIATVFAGVVVIAALVTLVNAAIRFLESRLFPWASGQVAG